MAVGFFRKLSEIAKKIGSKILPMVKQVAVPTMKTLAETLMEKKKDPSENGRPSSIGERIGTEIGTRIGQQALPWMKKHNIDRNKVTRGLELMQPIIGRLMQ